MSSYTQSTSSQSRNSRARSVGSQLTSSTHSGSSGKGGHQRGLFNARPYSQSNTSYATTSQSQAPLVEPQHYAETEYTHYTETNSQTTSYIRSFSHSGFQRSPSTSQGQVRGYARTDLGTEDYFGYSDTPPQSRTSHTTANTPRHTGGSVARRSVHRNSAASGLLGRVNDFVESVLSAQSIRAGARSFSRDIQKPSSSSGGRRMQGAANRQSRSLSRAEDARRSTAAPRATSPPRQARYDPAGCMQNWVNEVPEWDIEDDDMDPYQAMLKRTAGNSIRATSRSSGTPGPSSWRDPSPSLSRPSYATAVNLIRTS